MSSLCAQNHVSEMDVRMVPTPVATRSYSPVPYSDVLDLLEFGVSKHLDTWDMTSKEFGLARDGQQLFGVYHLDRKQDEETELEDDALRISIGFRSSHDKSLSLGVMCGASVFVCDNLMFNTSGFKAVRRHTKNVESDFDYLVWKALGLAEVEFGMHSTARNKLKEIGINQDEGYRILGHMYGHGLLKPVQMSSATQDWRAPVYETFKDRNAWSFYNAVTYGLKKGSPSLVIDRYTKANDWMMNNILGEEIIDVEVLN